MSKVKTFNVEVTGWKVYPLLCFMVVGALDVTMAIVLATYSLVKYLIS